MNETAFWGHLEYRVCRELERRPERDLRRWWCDGFIPVILRSEGRPRIEGTAWMGVTGQEEWRFTLLVGRRVRSAAELDWASLLPKEPLSGWLSLDPERRTLTIDPTSRRLRIRASS